MSRLSDERINSLMQLVESYAHYMKMAERHGDRFGDASGATTYWYKIREEVRAIEREVLKEAKVQVPTITMEQEFAWHQRQGFIRGHKAGQESMRERVASKAAEEAGEHGTDSDGWYICKSLSHQIEELEIEEPK